MISSSNRKAGPYAGDGSTTVFPFTFKVFNTSDVAVTRTDPSGAETVLTTGYSVSLNSNQDTSPGGTVTLTSALDTDYKLTLTSDLDETQPMQITNGGGFFPRVLNDSADRQTILIQQVSEKVGRALLAPVSSIEPTNGLLLPDAASRAGKLVAFDANGRIVPADSSVGPGDGGLRTDLAQGDGTALIGHTTSGTGTVKRDQGEINDEFVSVKAYGAVGDGVTDDTAAIQAALDDKQFITIPPGTYKTSACLEVHNYQIVQGAGSDRTLIYNNTTDCWSKDDVPSENGNFFQINGIGCIKDFDHTSRTIAFNLTNTAFIRCDDIAAKYFYTGVYLARSNTDYDSSMWCWYNTFDRVTIVECARGVHIDDSVTSQSVNGCFFSHMNMSGWDYRWYLADPSIISFGVRYSGYGNVFRDSYIQGFQHHIWRDQVGGANTLDGLYLESPVVPGQIVYAPARWFDNRDIFSNSHGDGFVLADNIYDPQRVFIVNTAQRIRAGQIVQGGGFETSDEFLTNTGFDSSTTGWTADTATLSSVAGGQSGNCLKVAQTGGSTGYAYQVVRTEPGKRYKLSVYHKNGTYYGRVLVGLGVTDGGYITDALINDAAWAEHIYYFTPTTSQTYIVLACAGTSNDTLFDTVSVTEVAVGADGDISSNGYLQSTSGVKVGQLKVLGAQGAAVANGVAAAAAPTQAEFNALVTQFNALLSRLRDHGVIAS